MVDDIRNLFSQCIGGRQCFAEAPIGRMKRRQLLKHLEQHGALFLREGTRHTIYKKGVLKTEIPRHTEIVDDLARKICRDLDIPFVR